jgi:DNA-binding response OmpR family regulator
MQKQIVLVEDDKTVSAVIAEALEKYQVQTAIDGIYGLKICRMQRPDLMIIDLILPRMSGNELIEKIREDDQLKAVPIIVISGAFSARYAGEKVDRIDADAVFSKPQDIEKFIQVVDSLLCSR